MAHYRTSSDGTVLSVGGPFDRLAAPPVVTVTSTPQSLEDLGAAPQEWLKELTLRNEGGQAIYWTVGGEATTGHPSLPAGGALTLPVDAAVAASMSFVTADEDVSLAVIQLG